MTTHLRVSVPITTMTNRRLLRAIDARYGVFVVGSRAEATRTLVWLRFDANSAPPDGAEMVRVALAEDGATDGVLVEPYTPRTDVTSRRRRSGTGSPWRTAKGRRIREERLARRAKEGPVP